MDDARPAAAGKLGDLAVRAPGDRYLGLRAKLRDADIVHTQELGYWYSMQAAQLKPRMGFRLVMTVWETIPFLDAYRNPRTRAYRARALAQTDLFLPTTERARTSLLLEGAPADRIRVCPPGVSTDRFAPPGSLRRDAPLILSPGRLVWEKGHQDVLRALALLRAGLPSEPAVDARLLIVGTGPEEAGCVRTRVSSPWQTRSSFAASSPTRRCPARTPTRSASCWRACPPGRGRSSSAWSSPRR